MLVPDLPEPNLAWKTARGYFSTSLLTGSPFEGAHGGWAWGIGFSLAGSYKDWPILIGIDFYSSRYSIRRGIVHDSDDAQTDGTSVRRRNKVLFMDLFLRLQPATWKARPYVEAVVGFKSVRPQYTVDALIADDDNTAPSDATPVGSVGAGTGVEISLNKLSSSARTYLTFSARLLYGGRVPFQKTVANAGGSSTLDARFSSTTALFMIGFAVDADLRALPED
jgi:hypothetical protein